MSYQENISSTKFPSNTEGFKFSWKIFLIFQKYLVENRHANIRDMASENKEIRKKYNKIAWKIDFFRNSLENEWTRNVRISQSLQRRKCPIVEIRLFEITLVFYFLANYPVNYS